MPRIAIVTLMALAISCSVPTSQSDEARIYEAILLDQDFTSELGQPTTVMVAPDLEQADVLLHGSIARFARLGAEQATVEALNRASMAPARVPTDIARHARLVVISDAAPRSPAPTRLRVAQAFARRYPGHRGYVRLSPIGFNLARSEAAVAAVLDCGGLCSHGNMFVLRRIDGRWQIVNREMPWIS